jgi:crotonobetainyl-CoA:carnitine CoA-transferase CaiB-like acyl-CoA transferase
MAGGIAAALLARERTGEPSVVDVSLMSVGVWATALSVTSALLTDSINAPGLLAAPPNTPVNPLIGHFRTADDRFITLMMLQPGRYFADLCEHLGLQELLLDERLQSAEGLMANANEVGGYVAAALVQRSFAEWCDRLQTLQGPWAPVQNPLDVAADPQVTANGYLLPILDADGEQRQLVANPVQFDEVPPTVTRAPQFAEHTDDLLRGLGKDDDEIIQLKIDGACT